MTRLPTLLALATATAAFGLGPSPVSAQAPGYQQIDNRRIFAEFHAEVLTQVNDLMGRWGAAWAEDRADALVDTYWEHAVLIPPDGTRPLKGQDEIRQWLTAALPGQGGMEAFMLDFDASGGMAVVHGNYLLQNPGTASTMSSGPVMTVYLLRGRTWKIRSQVFTRTSGG